MYKIVKLATLAISSLALVGQVYAANLSVQLEQPKSPTNQNSFDINFVTLDTLSRTVTVRCFKKGPGDAGFVQFGSDIVLTPSGGNSGNCNVTSSVLASDGSYEFQAQATAGADSATSNTVTLSFNTSGPGTPTNWAKEKIDDNTYKIHFRSADDAGKTVKVEVYRSENTSFNLDSGTLVGTVAIGSNTDADFTNDIPDTSKTYYYAVRAFDSAGNGSGVLGDVVTTTTTTTSSVTPTPAQGAIPVTDGGGNVLGSETDSAAALTGPTGATGAAGEALGESSASPEVVSLPGPSPLAKLFSGKKGVVVGGVIVALVLLAYAFAKRKESQG